MLRSSAALLRLVTAGQVHAQPGAPSYRDTVQALVEGSVRGMTLTAFVVEQHEKALATWKRVFLGAGPAHHETAHFLLYGKVTGRGLPDVGTSLEKYHAQAAKALGMTHDEPWSGKLAVYFVNDTQGYISF